MNTDNYNFLKSSQPQGVDDYSPYVDKQFQWVGDSNQGVYNNNQLSLVTWDLKNIYNSSVMTDSSDAFLAVPIVTCAVISDALGTTLKTAPNMASSLVTLKSNYQHLVHQLELTGNGKTLHAPQALISMFSNFKLLSQMSATDLKSSATTWGMSEVLDSPNSVQFLTRERSAPSETGAGGGLATVATAQPGVGLCNNQINGTTASMGFQVISGANQNAGCVNEALQRRSSRIVDTYKNQFNNIFGTNGASATAQPTILNSTSLTTEARPFFTVVGNYMYWYDVAIIPLKGLCDVMDKIGLVKKLDLTLKVYFNTGYLTVPVAYGNSNQSSPQNGKFINSTFDGSCPFTVNLIPDGTNGLVSGSSNIVAGCFIGKPLNSSISVGTAPGSINFGASAPSHFFPSCRFYYSQITLSPAFAEQYITENRAKSVIYQNVYINTFSGISTGANFSTLVQSGIRNPLGLLIVPLISTTCPTYLTGASTLGFSQYSSPYDTCPATGSPCSITNLAVSLGNKNVLAGNNLFYTYENFIEQVSLGQTIINEVSMNVGVFDQRYWEMNRFYYIDLGRSKDADKATDRNLNLSFTNNSLIPIDVVTFVIYLDKIVIDVETGNIQKE